MRIVDRTSQQRRTAAACGAACFLVLLIFAGTRMLTWTATYYGAAMLFPHREQAGPRRLTSTCAAGRSTRPAEDSDEYRSLMKNPDRFRAALSNSTERTTARSSRTVYRYEKRTEPVEDHSTLEQNIAFFSAVSADLPAVDGLARHAGGQWC